MEKLNKSDDSDRRLARRWNTLKKGVSSSYWFYKA